MNFEADAWLVARLGESRKGFLQKPRRVTLALPEEGDIAWDCASGPLTGRWHALTWCVRSSDWQEGKTFMNRPAQNLPCGIGTSTASGELAAEKVAVAVRDFVVISRRSFLRPGLFCMWRPASGDAFAFLQDRVSLPLQLIAGTHGLCHCVSLWDRVRASQLCFPRRNRN